jgi:hypothetical protein
MTPTPRDTAAEGNADGGIHAADPNHWEMRPNTPPPQTTTFK